MGLFGKLSVGARCAAIKKLAHGLGDAEMLKVAEDLMEELMERLGVNSFYDYLGEFEVEKANTVLTYVEHKLGADHRLSLDMSADLADAADYQRWEEYNGETIH